MTDPIKYRELKLARNRARDRAYYAKNREKKVEAGRRWRRNNPEKARAAAQKWRRAHPGADREHAYGITPDAWDRLFEAQGNACAVCKTTESGGRSWHTDHDHKTGFVRGILCWRCNIALGLLGDNRESVSEILSNVLKYLDSSVVRI